MVRNELSPSLQYMVTSAPLARSGAFKDVLTDIAEALRGRSTGLWETLARVQMPQSVRDLFEEAQGERDFPMVLPRSVVFPDTPYPMHLNLSHPGLKAEIDLDGSGDLNVLRQVL